MIIFTLFHIPLIATLSKVLVAVCKDGINKSHYFCVEQHLEFSVTGQLYLLEVGCILETMKNH